MPATAPSEPLEQAGYLEVSGAHLYTVLHRVPNPLARVLLVGPFAADRHFSYVPWVRWARFLAAHEVEALRFDYRGVGESTGAFEEMGFGNWTEDIEFLADWLQARSPRAPLVLQGLELGALLASKAFVAGTGDALVSWSAHRSANEVLRRGISRRVAVDQMSGGVNSRKSVRDYVDQLERGEPLEVDGYQWSSSLWRESFEVESPFTDGDATNGTWKDGRRLRLVRLDRSAAPLVNGSSLGFVVSLNPDLTTLFSETLDWIANAIPTVRND